MVYGNDNLEIKSLRNYEITFINTYKVIITCVVNLKPAQARCAQYNIFCLSLSVTLRQVFGFLRILWFPAPT